MSKNLTRKYPIRRITQWIVLPIFFITVGLGWKYPLLGFSVPLVMIVGLVGSFFNGRFVCGNLCPRGAFLDRVMSRFVKRRPMPALFYKMSFRIPVFVGLMGLMLLRILLKPGDIYHWGYVFWVMCVVTSVLGVVLAVLFRPRGWCTFCPMGTMQNLVGGGKNQLLINADKCVECKLCERVCPIGIPIVSYKKNGQILDRDCLKCSECVFVCPKKALSWSIVE